MPPMPTMSLRATPEHQPLIRDIARALKDRPDLADALRDVLQRNAHCDATQSNADDSVLQDVLRRIAYHDDVLRSVLQRVAELDGALQNATQRIADPKPALSERKPAPVTSGADDGTVYPIWTEAKAGARRLTETGQAALREMVAAGENHRAIAERFMMKPQNVTRFIRNNTGDRA